MFTEELLYYGQKKATETDYLIYDGSKEVVKRDKQSYYIMKVEDIESGKPTFVARNLDSSDGIYIDYYNEKKHIGFVYQNENDECCVCINGIAEPIHQEPISIEDAVELIRNPTI
jgi:hypothetical protein